ncbi:MAG TPA: hypothetical protein VFN95_18700, partial [Flavitalea sp.]|nr:hypothetical protein [Flavitalea sp.]
GAVAERLWLIIWDEQSRAYQVAPGSQVKLRLPERKGDQSLSPNVLFVPSGENPSVRRTVNSPGFPDNRLGLGRIVSEVLETRDNKIGELDDERIRPRTREAILQNLESGSELKGKYAVIEDRIHTIIRDRKWIFNMEIESAFDRVTAYYHLDYIQRYFREKLGFQVLDDYPHLNPLRLVLSIQQGEIASYEVNKEQITFTKFPSKKFTAVRDPRIIYHEYVHVITDAIARLSRAGHLITPRAKEVIQAQAMDEGVADYFACSLAEQLGAKAPKVFYYRRQNRVWTIVRELDKESENSQPISVNINELNDLEKWKNKKYELGELWGCFLWKLRNTLKPEIADIIIAHSLFFLTRWATFEQGVEAILLADRLLFSGAHKETIGNPKEVSCKIAIFG